MWQTSAHILVLNIFVDSNVACCSHSPAYKSNICLFFATSLSVGFECIKLHIISHCVARMHHFLFSVFFLLVFKFLNFYCAATMHFVATRHMADYKQLCMQLTDVYSTTRCCWPCVPEVAVWKMPHATAK